MSSTLRHRTGQTSDRDRTTLYIEWMPLVEVVNQRLLKQPVLQRVAVCSVSNAEFERYLYLFRFCLALSVPISYLRDTLLTSLHWNVYTLSRFHS